MAIRIDSIYLKNFKGIKVGLGRKELEVDFRKLSDKNIILILGDNATGKSTFMSALHCLPGSTDKRQNFIIDDKEGIKIVKYSRSDGYKYTCKIVYTPTKTGHSCKGFIQRINPDGEEEELNPNGLITSYKDIVASELGMTDSVLKLSSQNDKCVGFVDMTATERKVNMSTFLPDDMYSSYYCVADTIYKELKFRGNALVEYIGKLHPADVLEDEIAKVTKKINALVEKRDKCTSKISEYKTRIKVIKEDGVEDRAKELSKEVAKFSNETIRIGTILEETYSRASLNGVIQKDSTKERIDSIIDDFTKKAKEFEIDSRLKSLKISELMLRRNSISDQIVDKQNSIADIETNASVNELKDLARDYESRIRILESITKGYDPSITKDTYLFGESIIRYIKNYVESFANYDNSLVQLICHDKYSHKTKEEISDKITELTNERFALLSRLNQIESKSDPAKVLSSRPADCKIDSCPYIKNALELKSLKEEIPEIAGKISDLDKKIARLKDEEDSEKYASEIESKIDALVDYVNNNIEILSKLPHSNKYIGRESLLKVIASGGILLNGLDDFDDLIDKCESYEELQEIRNVKLPKVQSELSVLETKGTFINTTLSDLKKLTEEKERIISDIEILQKELKEINENIEYVKDVIESLSLFRDKKEEYDSLYTQLINDDKELKFLSVKLDEIKEYNEKIEEKTERLNEIDEELNPLTRQREVYKTEQIKLAEYKDELSVIQMDMQKCEVVRAALSVKDDGLPVVSLAWYMDVIRQTANSLLSNAFGGNLYLEEFIINSKEFTIPYRKNSEKGLDISFASTSERSFISLCLTMAIIEEIAGKYGICCLDEIDHGHSNATKTIFISILFDACRRASIQQLFMITHNSAFYRGYDNIGYILFPGADPDKDIDSGNSIEVTSNND